MSESLPIPREPPKNVCRGRGQRRRSNCSLPISLVQPARSVHVYGRFRGLVYQTVLNPATKRSTANTRPPTERNARYEPSVFPSMGISSDALTSRS